MTDMLVVVRSAEEAATAIAGAADRLVVPAPASDVAAERLVAEAIGRASMGSVTLWCADGLPPGLPAIVESCKADEIFVPAGGSGWPCPDARRGAILPFAERMPAPVFETVASQGFDSVLFGEGVQPRRLLEAVSIGHLQQQVGWARSRHLGIGFAGTMEMPDIPRLLAVAPDFLVFDGTVRRHGFPSGAIDPERIRSVRELMPKPGAETPVGARIAVDRDGRDRIFVRDWTVSIHLGAYEYEKTAQRVRFNVEAEVVRTAARASDLRDVVTYDLIADAISRATVEHVELVETIAEDIAAAVLAHPRVTRVDVTIEKLDLGPGSLGCRIVRSRNRAD